MRVSLFVTCFNDTLFPEAAKAVVAVLERLGHEVEFRQAQTCCGQMHLNGGYGKDARDLAGRFVSTFADAEAVVTPSSSCAATIRRAYADLLKDDADLAREAAALSDRVFEFSAFLVERLGVEDVGAVFPRRVAYHPTCSSLRGLRVGDNPLRLLRAVRGIELVELEDAAVCCGFGGAFSVKNPAASGAMLEDKMRAVTASGAEVLTALDTSCLMHIGGGLSRAKSPVRTAHLAEILASTEPAS